jgi:hypothetical protein
MKADRSRMKAAREAANLVPEPTEPDLFVEKAYRLWAIKQQGNGRRGPVSA